MIDVLLCACSVIPVSAVYSIYLFPAFVGFALGAWKWWAGLFWFFLITSAVTVIYTVLQYDEILAFYAGFTKAERISYVAHNIFAPLIGIMLNLFGVLIGYRRSSAFKLK